VTFFAGDQFDGFVSFSREANVDGKWVARTALVRAMLAAHPGR